MSTSYDKYYQTANLFGDPYPELITFFEQLPQKGTVLDLGCGQGRDALFLARLGYTVTGVDTSEVGLRQMEAQAKKEGLVVRAIVADLYTFDHIEAYDIILCDSLFHFAKKDRSKETALVRRLFSECSDEALIVICIRNTGQKVSYLRGIAEEEGVKQVHQEGFSYHFEDAASGHQSVSPYQLLVYQQDGSRIT